MHSTKITGGRPALIAEITSMITLNSSVPKFPTNLTLNGRGRIRRQSVTLIAISSYMTFLSANLTCRNVNARTKNTRVRRRWNLIRTWTELILMTSSATSLKVRPPIAKVSTIGTMKSTF